MAWTKVKTTIAVGAVVLIAVGTTTIAVHKIVRPKYNPKDFWATKYPKWPADQMQYMTNSYGHPLNYTFPSQLSTRIPSSISGLLNQCMEISGWQYLIETNVASGSVDFGHTNVLNGEQWVSAFENALQTGMPQWLDPKTKKFRKENLVLIRFPEQKTVLVLSKDKAAKYQ